MSSEAKIGPITIKFVKVQPIPVGEPLVVEISKNLDTIYLTEAQAVALASVISKRYPAPAAPTTGQ